MTFDNREDKVLTRTKANLGPGTRIAQAVRTFIRT